MGNYEDRALDVALSRYEPPEPKDAPRDCGVFDCDKRTSGDKPYCINHLDRIPYVHKLMTELSTMTAEEIMGGVDPYADPVEKVRRRQVVPIEFQVGATRFWVGLVRSRGIEEDPEPVQTTGPRRLEPEWHVTVRPFTRLLNQSQSRHVLMLLQSHRADRIPEGWLTSDKKLVREVKRRFTSKESA